MRMVQLLQIEKQILSHRRLFLPKRLWQSAVKKNLISPTGYSVWSSWFSWRVFTNILLAGALCVLYLREVCCEASRHSSSSSNRSSLPQPTHSLCSGAIGRFLWKPFHPACKCVPECVRAYVRAQVAWKSQKLICCPVRLSHLPPRQLLQDVFCGARLKAKTS